MQSSRMLQAKCDLTLFMFLGLRKIVLNGYAEIRCRARIIRHRRNQKG